MINTENKKVNRKGEMVNIVAESNFIWDIANKLRGAYMPDKYGDVIIPMTILRRFECTLAPTRKIVLEKLMENDAYPDEVLMETTGQPFYNRTHYTLDSLCKNPDGLANGLKNYVDGFSKNVKAIFEELDLKRHIDKMQKDHCLLPVVKAFANLDLSVEKFSSTNMGNIFENLIGRFYQNVSAGQFYTGRDVVKLLASIALSEGCDDILSGESVDVSICDQACGTGGMLFVASDMIRDVNPNASIKLYGQELMGQSHVIGLAEMLIRGQDTVNMRHADTLKEDCFPDEKMRLVLENIPFSVPYGGPSAKAGQEAAVMEEYKKGFNGRWGAGLPGQSDSQLLFVQSAINKLDEKRGRAAIIVSDSLLNGGVVHSGDSQVRRWLLENDLIDAIIGLPSDMFVNTRLRSYCLVISKTKSPKRKGKIQIIDAASICHKAKKAYGEKRNEFTDEDREKIVKIYTDFEENDKSKIFNNTDFIYREITVKFPKQRNYAITPERISTLPSCEAMRDFYDENRFYYLKHWDTESLLPKDVRALEKFEKNEATFKQIIEKLSANCSNKQYMSLDKFMPVLQQILEDVVPQRIIKMVAEGLSETDSNAEIQTDKNGKIVFDDSIEDTEVVKISEDIDEFMQREVLPYRPCAIWSLDEKLDGNKPIIKTGARILFSQCFYEPYEAEGSSAIEKRIKDLNNEINDQVNNIFED